MEVVEGFLNTPILKHRHISVEDMEAILDTPTYTYMDSELLYIRNIVTQD